MPKTEKKFIYATGKRKSAVARVRLTPGTGKKYVSFNKSKAVYKENTKAAKKKTYSSNKVFPFFCSSVSSLFVFF